MTIVVRMKQIEIESEIKIKSSASPAHLCLKSCNCVSRLACTLVANLLILGHSLNRSILCPGSLTIETELWFSFEKLVEHKIKTIRSTKRHREREREREAERAAVAQ